MGLKCSFHLHFVERLWLRSLLGIVCAWAPGTTGPHRETETPGTATTQIISIYIISTSITVVNNSSNLIHSFLCSLGNRDSIPMDFLPGTGNYNSHVHKTAVEAIINCIKSGVSDKSTNSVQPGPSLGLALSAQSLKSLWARG